jgi:hypothetical protein
LAAAEDRASQLEARLSRTNGRIIVLERANSLFKQAAEAKPAAAAVVVPTTAVAPPSAKTNVGHQQHRDTLDAALQLLTLLAPQIRDWPATKALPHLAVILPSVRALPASVQIALLTAVHSCLLTVWHNRQHSLVLGSLRRQVRFFL